MVVVCEMAPKSFHSFKMCLLETILNILLVTIRSLERNSAPELWSNSVSNTQQCISDNFHGESVRPWPIWDRLKLRVPSSHWSTARLGLAARAKLALPQAALPGFSQWRCSTRHLLSSHNVGFSGHFRARQEFFVLPPNWLWWEFLLALLHTLPGLPRNKDRGIVAPWSLNRPKSKLLWRSLAVRKSCLLLIQWSSVKLWSIPTQFTSLCYFWAQEQCAYHKTPNC